MAFVTISAPAMTRPLARISTLAARLRAEFRARRVYANTLRELRALSARERADLGIEPTMITRLAAEAAWGKR